MVDILHSYSNVTASTYVAGKLTMDRVYFDGGDAIAVKYYGPDAPDHHDAALGQAQPINRT